MKQLLSPANATFNASAKTITFATTIPSTISHILHVTNVTRGVLYFQPQGGPAYTGTYASPVLTLLCSTTGHADADKLEIFYDDNLTTRAVTGPLTDTQLRATPVPVSNTSLPLPSGASTSANQTSELTKLDTLHTDLAKGQQTASGSLPVVLSSDGPFATNFGLQADAAASTDTGSFSLLAFVKRALQNWTTLLAKVWAVTQSGTWTVQPGNTANTTAWKVDGSAVTQPVSGTAGGVLGNADVTLQNAATATGNGTTMDVSGFGTVGLRFQNTAADGQATIQFEASIDGTNWLNVQALRVASVQSGQSFVINTVNSGDFLVSVLGFKNFRTRISSYTSGAVTVTAHGLAAGAQNIQYISGPVTASSGGPVGDSVTTGTVLGVAQWQYNGAGFDRVRIPNIFKTVSATASGNTSLWAATSAKKHRILRYQIEVTANATLATAAVLVINLQDVTTTTNLTHSVYVGTAGSGTDYRSGWIDLGNGILCAATNTEVNVNLSAALTTGAVRVNICGTDE